MKILAVIGSPRTNGNTYKTVQLIEQRLKEKDNTVEFESIQLSRTKLEPCRGCYVCIAKGEELCPLKDERKALEDKIKEADAVIFASPVYTYNVSWIMKNFFDRFAYRCHRPDFAGKKAMVVTTTGAVGIGAVLFILSFMTGNMGFITTSKAGVTYPPEHEKNDKKMAGELKRLYKSADHFWGRICNEKPVKPTFIKLLSFKMQQKAFKEAPRDSADYKFWKEKGWLERQTDYYYKVNVGSFKSVITSLLCKILK